MSPPPLAGDTVSAMLPDALHSGMICAVAAKGQRDLQECANVHGDLFPGKPFDPAVFSTLALANAFSAPWLPADRLRTANRASLWAFRFDWLVDYLAASRSEVDDAATQCLAVADGSAPASGDSLAAFLATLRDDLSTEPCFADLHTVWRDELRRMFEAMTREFEWRSAGATITAITADEYLDNADNLGSSFVNVTHWIANCEPSAPEHVVDLLAATRAQQQVLRLLNDLGTVHRDLIWGDLNLLRLGVTEREATDRLADLGERCEQALRPLRIRQPRMAVFLERQMEFCRGFYGITDYWGSL